MAFYFEALECLWYDALRHKYSVEQTYDKSTYSEFFAHGYDARWPR
jgi:hypothetical protein